VKCRACSGEFFIGPPRMFGVFGKENDYVQTLDAILSGEHKRNQQHQNSYDLGA
jgi:hypothetical protein